VDRTEVLYSRDQYALAKAINRRGVEGSTGVIIGVVVALVILVAAVIPVTQSLVNNVTCATNSNLSQCVPTATGTNKTVLMLVPVFFGLAALVFVAGLFS
jgi:hypothetical protein